jgi:hypothetical protein
LNIATELSSCTVVELLQNLGYKLRFWFRELFECTTVEGQASIWLQVGVLVTSWGFGFHFA